MSADISVPEFDQEYPFLNQIAKIRRRSRRHIANGSAITHDGADREVVLRLLDESLATELACVLRYRRHYCMANASLTAAIRDAYLKHSREEQQHADRLAERIVQLGGAPNLNRDAILDHSDPDHSEYGYADGETLADMVEEELIAEHIAIENYREIIRYIGDKDTTTRRLFESILAVEEEHAEELASIRQDILRNARDASTANATPYQPENCSDLSIALVRPVRCTRPVEEGPGSTLGSV